MPRRPRSAFMATAAQQGAGEVPAFTGDPFSVFAIALFPTDAQADLQLLQASNEVRGLRTPGSDFTDGNYGSGGLTISDFDFRMDTITGTLNSPGTQAADVWILGSNGMRWGVQETGSGTTVFTGTLRVRDAGGGADHDTAAVTLSAESTP